MNNKSIWIRLNDDDFDDPFEKRSPFRNQRQVQNHGRSNEKNFRVVNGNQDFKCRQCGFLVSANRELAGVNNRNHCPCCLWSRHMDLHTPGDRKAICKSRMEPIGLTFKRICKRYGQNDQGELMLIHHCTGCGKLSINRIAADDDAQAIYRLYFDSISLRPDVKKQMETEGISVATSSNLPTILVQLFGRNTDFEEIQGNERVNMS
jgi:hypothetical protein